MGARPSASINIENAHAACAVGRTVTNNGAADNYPQRCAERLEKRRDAVRVVQVHFASMQPIDAGNIKYEGPKYNGALRPYGRSGGRTVVAPVDMPTEKIASVICYPLRTRPSRLRRRLNGNAGQVQVQPRGERAVNHRKQKQPPHLGRWALFHSLLLDGDSNAANSEGMQGEAGARKYYDSDGKNPFTLQDIRVTRLVMRVSDFPRLFQVKNQVSASPTGQFWRNEDKSFLRASASHRPRAVA